MSFLEDGQQENNSKNVLIEAVFRQLEEVSDVVRKEMITPHGMVTVIYISSLVDHLRFKEMVATPLFNRKEDVSQTAEVIKPATDTNLLACIIEGNTLLYVHEKARYFKVYTYSPPASAITQSDTESTVSGPRDAFTESLQTNLSLVKRRIKNSNLKSKNYVIGTETHTNVSILYIDSIVNPEHLNRVCTKLDTLTWPGFADITTVSQLMEEHRFSPFTQYHMTERPDSTIGYLLDGRIIIMMDNSPGVLICPSTFFEFFQSPEDDFNRWTTATLLRCLRFFGFFLTIMLTPFYISALSFHPEMLPFEVLINLQESRSRVPFPPVIEVLFMELVIEVLREAGTRMPTKIGQTIGIVGGIVIGTAAVEAGLVSNTLIVLVAISALLSFLPPSFTMSNSSRVIRYLFIISAGLFGLYGQMIAFAWLMHHLLSLKSLGEDYMAPVLPRKWSDFVDSVIRLPTPFQKYKKGVSRAVTDKKEGK
ncbi:spore germination protein [Sporosarcina sp. FSL K6-1522]|uniref:spore germination protein n=1 Tax=Sporosarcina sp. FSL K6-1522 TaxID=2921554 RepID=UPI00315A1737